MKVKVEAVVEAGVGIEIEGAEVILVEVKVLMSIQETKQALFKRSANIEQGMIHLNLVAGIAENQEGIYSSFSITIKWITWNVILLWNKSVSESFRFVKLIS